MAPAAGPASPDKKTSPRPAATFLVRGTFVLGTRSLFIVRGTVVTGIARARQRVIGLPGMEAEVQGVESNLLDISGGAPQSALTFRYARQAELARWSSLVTEGTLLSLTDAAATA